MPRFVPTILPVALISLLAGGCIGSTEDVPVPTGAITRARDAQVQAGMKQLEMSLLTCNAQSATFVGCQMSPVQGITPTVTATSFELRAGDRVSRYDATKDTVPCHATTAAPTDCIAW